MMTLNDCQVYFGTQRALYIDALAISKEGVSVIIGSNGSGKTLLLKLIAGLISSTGRITYTSVFNFPQKTWVPQSPILLNRSVYENIALPIRCQPCDNVNYKNAAFVAERTQAALTWAGIESLQNTNATTLSTGQQQLVALARAWALSPQLLLLDEPCANLDPKRQQQIELLIKELCHSGCKVIMSTHQLSQAQRIAKEIIFMSQGTVIANIATEIFFSPEKLGKLVEPTIAREVYDFIAYS